MVIIATIDVSQIDKSKIKPNSFKKRNGEEVNTQDLDLVLIPTPNGRNHYMVKQGTPKDDQTEMPIIGNANERGVGAKPKQGSNQSNSAGQSPADADAPF